MKIQVKRIYEPAAESDGFRVLVDRLSGRRAAELSRKAMSHAQVVGVAEQGLGVH